MLNVIKRHETSKLTVLTFKAAEAERVINPGLSRKSDWGNRNLIFRKNREIVIFLEMFSRNYRCLRNFNLKEKGTEKYSHPVLVPKRQNLCTRTIKLFIYLPISIKLVLTFIVLWPFGHTVHK